MNRFDAVVRCGSWSARLSFANYVDAQDYGEARLWYLKAAVQNDVEAEAALDNLYGNHEGVRQN
jgi:hypothetical protein